MSPDSAAAAVLLRGWPRCSAWWPKPQRRIPWTPCSVGASLRHRWLHTHCSPSAEPATWPASCVSDPMGGSPVGMTPSRERLPPPRRASRSVRALDGLLEVGVGQATDAHASRGAAQTPRSSLQHWPHPVEWRFLHRGSGGSSSARSLRKPFCGCVAAHGRRCRRLGSQPLLTAWGSIWQPDEPALLRPARRLAPRLGLPMPWSPEAVAGADNRDSSPHPAAM